MAIVAIVSYLGSGQTNPVTGEVQRVSLTTEQEVALGSKPPPKWPPNTADSRNAPKPPLSWTMSRAPSQRHSRWP